MCPPHDFVDKPCSKFFEYFSMYVNHTCVSVGSSCMLRLTDGFTDVKGKHAWTQHAMDLLVTTVQSRTAGTDICSSHRVLNKAW